MPARSEWKGFLQVNQLQVPVKAFSAAGTEPDISLNQLHRDCGERIRHQRICPIHGLIEPEQIVHGYRIADDHYLPIEPDELEQLRPDPDKAISVHCFVDNSHIDPIYHSGRTLYLVPDGPPGQRPFCVLRDGLKAAGRQAFSRFVISRREQFALLRPFGRLMAVTFLEYSHRVRPSSDYESEISTIVPGNNEMALVRQLIDTMTNTSFDFHRCRDQYMDNLSALIERKVAAVDLTTVSKNAKSDIREDDALMTMLKASLKAAGVAEKVLEYPNGPYSSRPIDEELQGQRIA